MSSFIILWGTKMLLFDMNVKCHQHKLLYHIGCSYLLNEAPNTRHSVLMFQPVTIKSFTCTHTAPIFCHHHGNHICKNFFPKKTAFLHNLLFPFSLIKHTSVSPCQVLMSMSWSEFCKELIKIQSRARNLGILVNPCSLTVSQLKFKVVTLPPPHLPPTGSSLWDLRALSLVQQLGQSCKHTAAPSNS